MNSDRPLILISNDDGYQARGIQALVEMVRGMGEIIVCAPTGVRSGMSRAFTMEVLTLDAVYTTLGLQVYACSGTPVDCVKMAYSELCPRKPDLILGGINHGSNASTNAQYSGTVGIAIEGALKGVPSIAFSLCDFSAEANFEPMRDIVVQLVRETLAEGLPEYTCLNVNVPVVDALQGTRYCRMAHGHWRKEVTCCQHPNRNYDYYWMTGFYQNDEPTADDTDAWALEHGYIAITPLTVDLTDHTYLREKLQR